MLDNQELHDLIVCPGEVVLKWRRENHITLKVASRLFECSLSHLADIEVERHQPSQKLLVNILWVLDHYVPQPPQVTP